MNTYTVSRDGERLDLIVWRWYGRLSGRAVEQVLDANPGLARLGPHALPADATIRLPTLQEAGVPGPRVF